MSCAVNIVLLSNVIMGNGGSGPLHVIIRKWSYDEYFVHHAYS